MSWTHFFTPMIFLASDSFNRLAASAIIDFSAGVSGRTFFVRPSMAGSLPSGVTSVFKRLDQMPDRAVDPRLVGGMNILERTAAPLLAIGGQLHFDHALRAET